MGPEKKLKLYEIFYSNSTKKSLDNGFQLFDARDVNNPTFREIPIFRKFCLALGWSEAEYTGLFSPRFTEKTGLKSDEIKNFISSKPGADIYLFHPFKHELTISSDFMQLAELEHPGIRGELRTLWGRIFNRDLPLVDSKIDFKLCCHCNYFVANHFFWSGYSDFILEFSKDHLSPDVTQYTLTKETDLYLPMSVFLFERALTHYLKDHPEITVENYSTNPEWSQIELFDGERLFCENLVASILNKPKKDRAVFFDLAVKAYYYYRRIMVREGK